MEYALNYLIDKSIEYSVCTDKSAEEVEKLIDLLVKLGYVQGEVVESSTLNQTPNLSISSTTDQLNRLLAPYNQLTKKYLRKKTEKKYSHLKT